ncbi:hypothetical protein G1H11_14710 [Phytoactinopolyspora alkaliphila]|uniref:Secreted protein n=1 Tax=Phytoactinopolyspora alkaliphila TaxID=1783498 RepID=A0A6N9YP03_9ACTN|nr:hypothetical protein [Phytoactinopolyspora alkaliphila]NED96559.1 hypothetical protein [Phytoactinopolyspora alkaliphila]
MDTWMWIVLLVVVALIVAGLVFFLMKQRSSSQLKNRFGPEYDRAVDRADNRREAEDRLREVADRRDHIDVVPLTAAARRQYAADWDTIQQRFVDEPGPAVSEADELIVTVMAERGYPVDDFHERADMVAADHPDVVTHYRSAYAIRKRGPEATTEDLREAFVHYRALFDKMLHDETDDVGENRNGTPSSRRGGRHDSTR